MATKKTQTKKKARSSKIGRPTKYREDFHPQDFIEKTKQGKHITQICRDWDIDRAQCYRWAERHDAFRNALKKGKDYLEAHYVDLFTELIHCNPATVNTTAAIFLAKNVVKWTDRIEENQNVQMVTALEFVDE